MGHKKNNGKKIVELRHLHVGKWKKVIKKGNFGEAHYFEHESGSVANSIMSHGVQLPDLFDCLSTGEAQREFLHELEIIRSLSLKLLE